MLLYRSKQSIFVNDKAIGKHSTDTRNQQYPNSRFRGEESETRNEGASDYTAQPRPPGAIEWKYFRNIDSISGN